MIELRIVDQDNYRDIQDLSVEDGQARFVGSNSRALAKAYAYRATARPFGIYADGTLVGFAMYRELEELGNYLIEKLMIDKRYQRRGHGRGAMLLLLDLMRREAKYARVCLCCNLDDGAALDLYRSLGFARDESEEEEANEIILALDLR